MGSYASFNRCAENFKRTFIVRVTEFHTAFSQLLGLFSDHICDCSRDIFACGSLSWQVRNMWYDYRSYLTRSSTYDSHVFPIVNAPADRNQGTILHKRFKHFSWDSSDNICFNYIKKKLKCMLGLKSQDVNKAAKDAYEGVYLN